MKENWKSLHSKVGVNLVSFLFFIGQHVKIIRYIYYIMLDGSINNCSCIDQYEGSDVTGGSVLVSSLMLTGSRIYFLLIVAYFIL